MPETLERPKIMNTYGAGLMVPDGVSIHKFIFQSGPLKAIKIKEADGSDGYYLEAPASSTVVDRTGDAFTLACEKKMEAAAKQMTIWLNHEYKVPEDIFGTCEKSELVAAVDDKQGACFDLIIRVKCHVENPRVMATWVAVDKGVRLGFSVGGYVPDEGYQYAQTPGGDYIFTITDIDLYEISVVGIPANQRAIIEDVAKGLRKSVGQRVRQQANAHRNADPSEEAEKVKELAALARGEASAVKTAEEQTPMKPSPDEVAAREAERQKQIDARKAVFETAVTEICAFFIGKEQGNADEFKASVGGVITKLADDEHKTVMEAMGHLRKCFTHGICDEGSKNLMNAHKCLRTLVPDVPDDIDQDGDDDEVDKAKKTLADLQEQMKQVSGDLDARSKALDSFTAQAAAADEEITRKRKEISDLDALIATRAATPLARKTQDHVNSGSLGGESTADPERRKRSTHDIMRDLSATIAGTPQDARSRSI